MGLSIAEAMDTAQRGMGLDWSACRELIRRTAVEAKAAHGGLACGATTDQLPPGRMALEEIERAYDEQCAFIEDAGAAVVVVASRHRAASARWRCANSCKSTTSACTRATTSTIWT